MTTILEGTVIGGAGGAVAGLTVWLVQYLHDKAIQCREKNSVFNWLKKNTTNEEGSKFRSTRTIASWNNLTIERVRQICSIDKRIYLSTGKEDDMWSIHEHTPRNVYDERGMRSLRD